MRWPDTYGFEDPQELESSFQNYQTLDLLVRNAFDFIERAIQDFNTDPKFSIINFCTAIELILKAKLAGEDWRQILAQPKDDYKSFLLGKCKSIRMEDAIDKLDDLPQEARSSFRSLARHRNIIIHFFHAGLNTDEQAKTQIVAEQCRSWFHLHRLLAGYDFKEYRGDVAQADGNMKTHANYLRIKFESLWSELKEYRKIGNTPVTCEACSYEAGISEDLDDQILVTRCKVCDHVKTRVHIDCPHCDRAIVIANEGHTNCSQCEKAIEPEHLVDILEDEDAAYRAIKDGDDSWARANCSVCEGYHTVVRRSDRYFCASCFDISDQTETCGWCGERNTGDMSDSYIMGCGQCDGAMKNNN